MNILSMVDMCMNWTRFRRRSLKTKITFVTLGIFLLSLWTLSFYTSQMLYKDMQRLLGEEQFTTISMIAALVNRELEDRLEALNKVARSSVGAMQSGPAAMQSLIEQRLELQTLFNGGVYATGLDGTAIADFPLSARRLGVNYIDRDYIATPLSQGISMIGRPVIGKRALAPVFVMTVPISDAQGKVIGILAGVTRLDAPNFLDHLSTGRYGLSGGYLLVEPQGGMIVTASDKNRVMEPFTPLGINPKIDRFIAGQEGTDIIINSQGVEVLISASRIPVAGWFLMAELPTAEAFSPVRKLQQRMLLATIVLTVLAGWLIWWVVARQLSPLLLAADALSASGRIPRSLSTNDDEIGQLIGGFNRLLEILRHRESDLRGSEERFRAFDEASRSAIFIHRKGVILVCNQALAEISGYDIDELVGMDCIWLIAPESRELVAQNIRSGLEKYYDVVGLCKDGRRYHISIHSRDISYKGHTARAAEFLDITERKQAEEKLRLAANVFTHAREGILITDTDGTIIEVNDSFSRITGYPRDEVLGRNPRLLSSGRQEPSFYSALWRDLIGKGHWYGELWNRHKSGEIYASMQTISVVRDAQGVVRNYVALFSDITMVKTQQKQLEYIAHYDALTALPNRLLLTDRLHQSMAQAPRRETCLAVVFLDLDGFKQINDRHGHATGDHLLTAIADRMKQALREGDTLARMGGDEFVAVLTDLVNVTACIPTLDRLLAAAAHPVTFGEVVLQVSASLGVTSYPQAEEVEADQLLRQADQAMYQAKQFGKNRYHFFDAEQDRNVRGHHASLEHIRHALSERELVLYYQPKVNMQTGGVIGAEALLRWQHPERGLLPPAVFLPVIEDHPLAIEVGEWVIDSALTQIALWHAAGLDIRVSVNVGARQLQHPGFTLRLRELLAAHPGIRPFDLELEVLETSALDDLSHVARIIEDCNEIGVSFSLDDFGTGYSSLNYLKRLSVQHIKIDKSFVHDMLNNPDDLAILKGILGLSSAFNLQAIAEGVETIEHGTVLLQLGCERAQGYAIACPMPAAEFQGWAATWRPNVAWNTHPPLSHDDLPQLCASQDTR